MPRVFLVVLIDWFRNIYKLRDLWLYIQLKETLTYDVIMTSQQLSCSVMVAWSGVIRSEVTHRGLTISHLVLSGISTFRNTLSVAGPCPAKARSTECTEPVSALLAFFSQRSRSQLCLAALSQFCSSLSWKVTCCLDLLMRSLSQPQFTFRTKDGFVLSCLE